MTSTMMLALASILLSAYIAFAMKMPLTSDESSSIGDLLKTPKNRRQPLHSDNAVASRLRRSSPHQDDNPKYRAPPQGQKYEGVEGNRNQLARGPYYDSAAVRSPYDYAGSFESLDGGGAEIPRMSERSFDSLGGGELPWVDRRSKARGGDSRGIQQRAFDTLGGGELPWIGGKRSHQRK